MENVSIAQGTVGSQHGRIFGFLMHRAINPVMRRMLAGRLHRLMGSDTLMVLSFRGRRSGQIYTFPIGYMQEGNTLVCYTPFGWWRNLEGGAPVSVILRGKSLVGTADVSTETAEVADGLVTYLTHNPGDARFFYVSLDKDKRPSVEDAARTAETTVQVRIDLEPAGS